MAGLSVKASITIARNLTFCILTQQQRAFADPFVGKRVMKVNFTLRADLLS
jgi:hypothetical protein